TEMEIRRLRKELGVVPVYKLVDTCAAEFEAYTPYYYSTYETPVIVENRTQMNTDQTDFHGSEKNKIRENPSDPCSSVFYSVENETKPPSGKDRIMILGGGPNRIGQGIEFDYCCCQAAFALRREGYETIMVNSNPETVSTDYDTSDHLFFEPLTTED